MLPAIPKEMFLIAQAMAVPVNLRALAPLHSGTDPPGCVTLISAGVPPYSCSPFPIDVEHLRNFFSAHAAINSVPLDHCIVLAGPLAALVCSISWRSRCWSPGSI